VLKAVRVGPRGHHRFRRAEIERLVGSDIEAYIFGSDRPGDHRESPAGAVELAATPRGGARAKEGRASAPTREKREVVA
jgi:hypothetical protein